MCKLVRDEEVESGRVLSCLIALVVLLAVALVRGNSARQLTIVPELQRIRSDPEASARFARPTKARINRIGLL